MKDILDLDRFPLDRPRSAAYRALVRRCQDELAGEGLFSLHRLVRPEAIEACAQGLAPRFEGAYVHKRAHNVYFLKQVPGLPEDHPALRVVETQHLTLCADLVRDTLVTRLYEWEPLQAFLAEAMGKPSLYPMDDPLARINVMGYRAGEGLNWHFDRSQFTTTLLIQAPEHGGQLEYRYNLRSVENPNYQGVARVLAGEDPEVRVLTLAPGTLNVFLGKNTLHRVSPPAGARARVIAIFSYYDRPGVTFTPEERMGFYGRVA